MNLYKQEKTNKKITELLKTNNFSKQEIKTITKNDFLTTNCRKKSNDFCCNLTKYMVQQYQHRNTKGNKTVCKDAPKPDMPMDDVFG